MVRTAQLAALLVLNICRRSQRIVRLAKALLHARGLFPGYGHKLTPLEQGVDAGLPARWRLNLQARLILTINSWRQSPGSGNLMGFGKVRLRCRAHGLRQRTPPA